MNGTREGQEPPWADAVRGVAERAGLDPGRVVVEAWAVGRGGTVAAGPARDDAGRASAHGAAGLAAHDVAGLAAHDATRTAALDGSAADYRAAGGRLTLRATDPVAAAVALGRYARAHLGAWITWRRPTVADAPLPHAPRTAVSSPHEVRYYLNVVTFGYSTAFWGWDRWEREIDWMALHGVTHPLALVGHEAVLAETFRRAGLPPADAARWIGGAAHLPWTFMGGMHSFGEPLPARWAERRVHLARRILARMRELGMTPVLPGFGGHVPPALVSGATAPVAAPDEYPPGEIEWQGWRIPLLRPGSARFRELHAVFGEVQRALLGPGSGYYAVDPYIESVPPSGDAGHLRAAGRGMYQALAEAARAAGEADPVWVLQGWPFHYQGAFWTPDRVAAYLRDVPAGRTLVLDLWGEHVPLHRALLADGAPLAGRPWVWCALHNFGGRPALFGDLAGLVRDVRALPDGVPHLRGVGLAPEAIENNEVFYELATDLAWDDAPHSPAGLDAWLRRFVLTRYGLAPRGSSGDPSARPAEVALRAWHTIFSTLYGPGRTRSTPTPVIARPWAAALPFPAQRSAGEAVGPRPPTPSSDVDAENDPAVAGALPLLAEAVRDLATVRDEVPAAARELLAADLADLTGYVLAQGTRVHVRGILAAARAGDPDGVRAHMTRLRADLLELDRLAAARPETRVGTWIDAARAWGDTDAERDAMEREARSLVSVWGGQHNGLHDYSGRHWQGLVRDLYLPRWQAWADWLADAAGAGPVRPDTDPAPLRARIVAIEEAWRGATSDPGGTAGDDRR